MFAIKTIIKGRKMKIDAVKKLYKYLYIINLWLIIGIFLYTCIGSIFSIKEISEIKNVEFLRIYCIGLLLAPTLCISFLGLNIWGLFIDKPNKKKLIVTIIILSIWIYWGIYTWSKGVVFP